MPIEFSEDLFQNDDFKVETDNNGDLVQTHKQTGAEFKFDASKNRWVPVQGLDLGGATIDNVGSIDSDSIDVNSLSATQLAQALDASGNDLNNVGAGDFDSINTEETKYDLSGGSLREAPTRYRGVVPIHEDSYQQFQVGTSYVAVGGFGGFGVGVFFVAGFDTSDSSTQFVDVVTAGYQINPVVQFSAEDAAASRNYDQTNDQLELAMGSGTYDVGIRSLAFDVS